MSETNHLTRCEAYSDGVFAIASTLLVLEIRVPEIEPAAPVSEMWHRLAELWPSYIAFALSFGTILVMWVTHHRIIRMLKGTSTPFLYANGFLLFTITFVPFPTALLARYIQTSFALVVVVFYAGSALLTNVGFLAWFTAMQRPIHLFKPDVSREQLKTLGRRTWAGFAVYVLTAAISWWFPVAGLCLMGGLFVFWAVLSAEERGSG